MSLFQKCVARGVPRLRIAAFALALPLSISIPADQAIAACVPAAGPNVTCSGTTTNAGDGFGDGTQNNFTINVLSGATVTGLGGDGLFLGFGNTVTNAGTITGMAGAGINSAGVLSVFNSGTISSPVGDGIIGNDLFITNANSGVIIGSGVGSIGINGDNVALTNFGTVAGVLGGVNANINAVVTNYGAISGSLAPGGVGVIAAGNLNLTNYGTISGDTAVIGGLAGGHVIVNAGTIRGVFSSIDLSFGAGGDTVTLLPGSRLIRSLELGNGNAPSTVNIVTGRDIGWLITTGGCGCGGIVENGATVNFLGGAPGIVVGNQIATLDPTAFGQADKNLMHFSGWVASLFGSRLGELGVLSGQGATAFAAASPSPIVDKANEAFAGALPYAAPEKGGLPNASSIDRASGTAVWSKGFAGVRKQQGDELFLESRSTAYGGAIGLDGQVQPGLRLGAFVGGGTGKFETDKSSQTIDTDYVFGGVYGRFDWITQFLDFALTVGHTTSDNARMVANNMAPDGIETAKSNYDGWFVNPELAYGVRMPFGKDTVLTPVARVRYLAGHFDGYAETGSAQNLVVNGRDIQNLEERLELNLSRFDPFMAGIIKTTATAGLVAQQRVGNKNISTVLLGQNLVFATPGDDSTFGGFAGLGFDYRASQRVSVFAGVEGTIMDDKSRTGTARAGARVAF